MEFTHKQQTALHGILSDIQHGIPNTKSHQRTIIEYDLIRAINQDPIYNKIKVDVNDMLIDLKEMEYPGVDTLRESDIEAVTQIIVSEYNATDYNHVIKEHLLNRAE